ncbi:binding protein [Carpediemonas membranifera]|uniref:Binding protein n=1 Tax=Carpediemonas membranifera TaxID=201153 RepID=A0A8J6ARH1_9EUKA|nr:binding protein [Carpediemonas membranifera]|eukprot:KAG9392431.1 binding protein [Carpediemonas membranifera]
METPPGSNRGGSQPFQSQTEQHTPQDRLFSAQTLRQRRTSVSLLASGRRQSMSASATSSASRRNEILSMLRSNSKAPISAPTSPVVQRVTVSSTPDDGNGTVPGEMRSTMPELRSDTRKPVSAKHTLLTMTAPPVQPMRAEVSTISPPSASRAMQQPRKVVHSNATPTALDLDARPATQREPARVSIGTDLPSTPKTHRPTARRTPSRAAVVEERVDSPLLTPARDLKTALAGLEADGWEVQKDALVTVQRAAQHSIGVLLEFPELPRLFKLILATVDSLRSGVAKVALETLRDIYVACSGGQGRSSLFVRDKNTIVSTLNVALKRACVSNAFLTDRAHECLLAVASSARPDLVISGLLAGVRNRNASYRAHVAEALGQTIPRLPSVPASYQLGDIVKGVYSLVTDQSSATRTHGRACLMVLHTELGEAQFRETSKKYLNESQSHDLMRAARLAMQTEAVPAMKGGSWAAIG